MTSDKDLRKSLIHEISLCDNRLAHIFKSLRERGWYFQIKVLLKSFVSSDIMIEVVVTSPLLLTALMLMLMNLMLNVKLLPTATPFTWIAYMAWWILVLLCRWISSGSETNLWLILLGKRRRK